MQAKQNHTYQRNRCAELSNFIEEFDEQGRKTRNIASGLSEAKAETLVDYLNKQSNSYSIQKKGD